MDYPLHPITGDYDDLTEAEVDALRESLRQHGLLVPIVIWRAQTVDGRHRKRLCAELGIELRTDDITDRCKTEDEMVAYVRALNEHRRANTKPLTNAEKRARIEAALQANPELSNRQIAEKVGASHPTVAEVREQMAATGKITGSATTIGKDGKSRHQPAGKTRPSAPASAASEPARGVEEEPGQVTETASAPTATPVAPAPQIEATRPVAPAPVSLVNLFAMFADVDSRLLRLLELAPREIEAIAEEYSSAAAYIGMIHQLMTIEENAAGIEEYMSHASNTDAKRKALQIQWQTAGKCGALLGAMRKAGYLHPSRVPKGVQIGTLLDCLSYEDLGIDRKIAFSWQWVTGLSEAEVRKRVAEGKRLRKSTPGEVGDANEELSPSLQPPAAAAHGDLEALIRQEETAE